MMHRFLARRFLHMGITLVCISILSFILIELPPGSFIDIKLQELRAIGGDMSQQQISDLEARYGVHDPLPLKYWKWISGVVHGDFGESFTYGVPVSRLIWGRLGISFLLSFFSILFAWLVSIPLGVYSATHRYTLPDHAITVFQFVGVAIPEFLIALVLIIFASRSLHLDVGGLLSPRYADAPWSWPKLIDLLQHVWIPVVVISLGSTAWLTRVMRANLLDVLNAQYIQTARAKGLAEGVVIWKHAVRNALHPLIMAAGGMLPALISGEVIASIVLNLPTTGPLFIEALLAKDMYLAVTFLMFEAIMLLVGNLLADLALVWADPRIRLE